MRRLRSQLTFANTTAVIALFVALGGGAYAATSLPKNSVGANQIKANAVTSAKIKNGAVTAAKIAPGSIGTVADASHAATADSATRAGNAETATRATSAETANRATTAETATRAVTAESATRAATADSASRATTSENATHADKATEADHATSADSATTATTAASATLADDAKTLEGLSSNKFAPAANFLSGGADLEVPTPQPLFTIPGGPELRTTGTGNNQFEIGIRNPITSTEDWTLSSEGSRLSEVSPGGSGSFGLAGNLATITVVSASLKRSVTGVCTYLVENAEITCSGTLYEAP